METSEVEVRAPGDKSIKISRWKVKSGSKVGRGALLALYETAVTKGLKLKSTMVGTVSEVLATDADFIPSGTVLLKMLPCSHPVVMKDMCADCGADLRKDAGVSGTRKEPVSASVAMVHNIPELIISKEQALELGKADEENLLKNRKLVLLVDLDQTLIHTTNDDIPPKLKDVYHFQIRHGNTTPWFHTKLRPGTQAFLEKVSKLYELHICTFGSRMYAHIIANFLDPDGKYFSHRILSRDECFNQNSKTANLKALFPCGDSMVCIIDDREDVWNFSPNLIHVKPYRFFQGTADINAPPGLDKTEHDAEPVKHKVVRTLSRSNSAEDKQSNSDECVKPVINTESEKLDKKADLETRNGEDRQEKSANTNQNEDKSSKSEVSEDSSSNQNNSSINLTEKVLGNTEIHSHDALHDNAGVCRENGNKSSAEQKTCITDNESSVDGEKGSESKIGDSQPIDSANGERSDTDTKVKQSKVWKLKVV
ncbi:hypothetical protein FSP39_024385 [Pinctada imbricata]|uniref:RNA polymerase II subunit A C-terminal domain phosphatase n=1 Tax=Pinctada imbricata TaxID=66713 RepID=A0AA89BPZ3_PINIB|nr:hypothetical protein FSP39_024385 [Pinctada imbricata]